jgi:hypothetical protein
MSSFLAKALLPIALLGLVNAAPIDSCSEQADCLTVTYGECSATCERVVCLKWMGGGECVKSGSDTVSHSCPVVGGLGSEDNEKVEPWAADTEICVTVTGGQDAIFGVKDASACSGGGYNYDLANGDHGFCQGPLNVCEGGSTQECAWSFETEECDMPGWFD